MPYFIVYGYIGTDYEWDGEEHIEVAAKQPAFVYGPFDEEQDAADWVGAAKWSNYDYHDIVLGGIHGLA